MFRTMSNVSWDLGYHVNELQKFHFDYAEMISITVESANGFPAARARKWMGEHHYFFVQCGIAYFFAIFGIKLFMRNRQPFDLQRPLNVWNSILAVFSVAGTIYMTPEFFTALSRGVSASYCDTRGMEQGAPGFWMWLFTLSKLAEFVDTFFIVLRKKPLMFLHWYHHILTLWYAVFTYAAIAFNRWAFYLNLAVHSFMYTYYFLRSINVKIPGAIAKSITTGQILQFVISIFVLVGLGLEHYVFGNAACTFKAPAFWLATGMELSYLVLFLNFFLQSYVVKGGKAKYAAVNKEDNKKKQ